MTISEAFAAYESRVLYNKTEKTRQNYHVTMKSILHALGDIPIELIGEEQLVYWDHFMTQECNSSTTKRGYIIQLRAILKYFRKKGVKVMDASDIEIPKSDTKPRDYITAEQVKKLVAVAKNPRDRAIIACYFLTGARASELLSVKKPEYERAKIDADGIKTVMIQGKNGKYRELYFRETARSYIDAYLRTRQDFLDPLFISAQNRCIGVSRVEQIVHQATANAGIDKHVTPHIMRHSFATDLLLNKAPLYEVSKSMGHANISTTANIYGHFDTYARKRSILRHQSSL